MGFCKEIVIRQSVSVSQRYQFVHYLNKVKVQNGTPGSRDLSRTHSLFVDDRKQYQENHETLKDVNEIIVQASHDTGAC